MASTELLYAINDPRFAAQPPAVKNKILAAQSRAEINAAKAIWDGLVVGWASAAAQAEIDNFWGRVLLFAQRHESAQFAVAQYNFGVPISDPYYKKIIDMALGPWAVDNSASAVPLLNSAGKINFDVMANLTLYEYNHAFDSGGWWNRHGAAVMSAIVTAVFIYVAWPTVGSTGGAPAGSAGGTSASAVPAAAPASAPAAATPAASTASTTASLSSAATTASEVAGAATALQAAFQHPTPPSVPPQQTPTAATPPSNGILAGGLSNPLLLGAAVAIPFILP